MRSGTRTVIVILCRRLAPGWHVLTGVKDGEPQWSDVLSNAQRAKLPVFVYTLRADDLPEGVESHRQLRGWLKQAGVTGVFSDFPDKK